MPKRIFDILDELNIFYTNYQHQAVISCSEAKWIDIPWKRVKSLLIHNKKKTQFYMIVLEDNKKLETNKVRDFFNDTKMSFSSQEDMIEKIWVKIWHVSPFALVNNIHNDIKVVFDTSLLGVEVWFHPLTNDQTIVLGMQDVEKFLQKVWNDFFYLDL